MRFSELAYSIFEEATRVYHEKDDVDTPVNCSYASGTIEASLYMKNWIDAVQWHLEDIIRDPKINAEEALKIKRRIDQSNQVRTDLVEQLDSYFLARFKEVKVVANASINTESPAWAIDRLSILCLKIYHMNEEVNRMEVDDRHHQLCRNKLTILLEQKKDLMTALDQLLEDMTAGRKYMKVYRQMKMYNDPSLNPVLYAQAK